MNIINCFDRVYINLPETYDEEKVLMGKLHLPDLIYAVAKANPYGNGNTILYDENSHEFYEGRTKSFIVQTTKEYISKIPECFSPEENMATFVSLRQFKKLIYAFEKKKKRISCYGLIYLYIIYTLLKKGKSPKEKECKRYLEVLDNLVSGYLENNPSDELALFFHGCYKQIIKAIEENNINLDPNLLPKVPRNHPNDELE